MCIRDSYNYDYRGNQPKKSDYGACNQSGFIIIILLIALIFAGIQLRDMGFLESEEYYDDEIEEVVGTIVTEDGLVEDG